MKKVIREVKDLKYYMQKKTICFVIALIIAFFVNYIPVALGASVTIILLLYILFTVYSYCVCLVLYNLFTSPNKRVKTADFDMFLINKGEPVKTGQNIHLAVINPFKKNIKYRTKNNNGSKVMYVFDLKNNIYYKC